MASISQNSTRRISMVLLDILALLLGVAISLPFFLVILLPFLAEI